MFECNDCSVMLLEGSMHVCRPKPSAYDFAVQAACKVHAADKPRRERKYVQFFERDDE